MTDKPAEKNVAVVRFGPVCGERTSGGYQAVGTSFPPELQRAARDGALVVIGHPIRGLEHLVTDARAALSSDHIVVFVKPCHSTIWFWDDYTWREIEEITDPDVVVDECVDINWPLLRDILSTTARRNDKHALRATSR